MAFENSKVLRNYLIIENWLIQLSLSLAFFNVNHPADYLIYLSISR